MNSLSHPQVRSKQIERVLTCELCPSTDDVQFTADPDRGGLQLCRPCRVLFGFEEVEPENTQPEELPF